MNDFTSKFKLTFVFKIIIGIFNFLTTVLLARSLDTALFGAYFLLRSSIDIALPIAYSIDGSNVFYINRSKDNSSKLFGNSIFLGVISSFIPMTIYYFSYDMISDLFLKDISNIDLRYIFLLLPLFFTNITLQSLVYGSYDLFFFNLLLFISSLINIIFTAIFCFFMKLSVHGAILALVIDQTVVFIICFIYLKNKIKTILFDIDLMKKSVKFAFKQIFSDGLDLLVKTSDKYFISFFKNNALVAIYFVYWSTAEKANYINRSISSVLYPKLCHTNEDKTEKMCLVNKISMILNLTLTLLLAAFGILIIKVFYGEKFIVSNIIFYILLLACFLSTIGRNIKLYILSEGYPEYPTYASIVAFIIVITLNFILVPYYGMTGAAAGTLIGYFFYVLIVIWYFIKITKTNLMKIFWISKKDIYIFKQIISKNIFSYIKR